MTEATKFTFSLKGLVRAHGLEDVIIEDRSAYDYINQKIDDAIRTNDAYSTSAVEQICDDPNLAGLLQERKMKDTINALRIIWYHKERNANPVTRGRARALKKARNARNRRARVRKSRVVTSEEDVDQEQDMGNYAHPMVTRRSTARTAQADSVNFEHAEHASVPPISPAQVKTERIPIIDLSMDAVDDADETTSAASSAPPLQDELQSSMAYLHREWPIAMRSPQVSAMVARMVEASKGNSLDNLYSLQGELVAYLFAQEPPRSQA